MATATLRFFACALLALLSSRSLFAAPVPFWGARHSSPAGTPADSLKNGEFVWTAEAIPAGPMAMIVDLTSQRGYVYRNGVLVGATTVSTGRPGHETPVGVFTILQKDKDHRSTIYNQAPMPYMERLTWGGVALHAGGLPGYPESHGCVHLPSEFARLLFGASSMGMTVVIQKTATAPAASNHPGYLQPTIARDGQLARLPILEATQTFRWQPELASEGPLSIVMSRISGRIVVYRNGVEIGRSRVTFSGSGAIGTHALVLVAAPSSPGERFVPDPRRLRWMHIGIAGHLGESGTEPDAAIEHRIDIPEEFVNAVYQVLRPGATVLVTDEALTAENSGQTLDVIDADPPATAPATAGIAPRTSTGTL